MAAALAMLLLLFEIKYTNRFKRIEEKSTGNLNKYLVKKGILKIINFITPEPFGKLDISEKRGERD